ncbi:MAG: hypothetical protein ACI3VR_11855 [Intestinibacter sp.]|uniref:hypothetical protein n=1 Tax=Intestinibacter sp. TaxID=1965304 RepID=UPI003F180FAA
MNKYQKVINQISKNELKRWNYPKNKRNIYFRHIRAKWRFVLLGIDGYSFEEIVHFKNFDNKYMNGEFFK